MNSAAQRQGTAILQPTPAPPRVRVVDDIVRMRDTSETTSTSPRGLAVSGPGARWCCRVRPSDLVDGFPLTDLGEHRLKDIAEPVSIFQLGRRALPAVEDDLEHESPSSGELVRRQGA